MRKSPEQDRAGSDRVAWILLLACGALLILLAGVYNFYLLSALQGSDVGAERLRKIHDSQVALLASGGVFVAASLAVRHVGWLRAAAAARLGAPLLLAAIAIFLPLWVLELGLRPFTPIPRDASTIYIRDADLGWRLRPDATAADIGKGVVSINAKGLRGPELPYERVPGVQRVLYLGDSVTYGWGLDLADSYPSKTELALERRGVSIETVNAAVSGYSPWQHDLYLSREGMRYDPTLVVLGFVLNDVVEKFSLTRFGGADEGRQLALSAQSFSDVLAANSAVYWGMRRLIARLRYGADLQQGAAASELISVEMLVTHAQEERVRAAWRLTLDNVRSIVEQCRARGIPVLLLAFPYTFQFENPELYGIPQRILRRFAARERIPVLDLLSLLHDRMQHDDAVPDDYYLDDLHLNERGSSVVAGFLSDFLLQEDLLQPQGPPPTTSDAGGLQETHP